MKMKMKMTLALLLIMELYGLSTGLKHHFFVKEQMAWVSAKKYCRTYFHDLSAFTNENEQQQFLKDATNQTSNAWVGLYSESGVWKWSGGENATQIFWDAGQPDKTDGCVYAHNKSKKLHDKGCTIHFAAYCMTTFTLVHQKETWEGALEYCRTHYNDLASLSTMERLNSALLEISQAETEYVWTGLRFLAGDWFWLNGDELKYIVWNQTEQPQCPATDLRCGALDKQTKLLTPRDCEETFNFFC